MAAQTKKPLRRLSSFGLEPGYRIEDKYRVEALLGTGWEGEVYLIRELATGIERTAKIFFPQRNPRNQALRFYARKLHKLRQCPIVIQYHTRDTLDVKGMKVSFLVSEFVEGELLSEFLKRQRGRRLTPFQGVHLLYALARGIECIHAIGEYHGDLHMDNIIVQRHGLGFDLKLLDMFHWGRPSSQNIRNDVFDLIRIFYDVLGGRRYYAGQPAEVKAICCGLRHSLISGKFRSAGQLRAYLENLQWN
jgi:serine/threonine protein kinase